VSAGRLARRHRLRRRRRRRHRRAKVAGATTIIAVDVDDRKLEQAKKFGATHTINSKTEDAVEKIREYTGGFGADVVVEAVGRPETYEQAFFARDLAGTVVLVGVPTPTRRSPCRSSRSSAAVAREVVLVRRLPGDFPMLDRPLQAGPASTSARSSPRRSAR
jgi:threonine dehydrogenase-like Zn-dependent dehydrogenase